MKFEVAGNRYILLMFNSNVQIVQILVMLFVNGLLPKSFSPLGASLPWAAPIPLREKPVRPARKPDPVKESGLFSQLSSYLSTYATDEPSPPSDEEIERTLCTVDCIKSCHFEEVSRNLMYCRHTKSLTVGN